MRQFSLEDFRKYPNKRVITRDGDNVKILCTDKKSNDDHCPIVALVQYQNKTSNEILFERPYCFDKNGRLNNDEDPTELDLFFEDEKHTGWLNVYNDRGIYYSDDIYDTEETAISHQDDYCDFVNTVKIEWYE